MKLQGCTRCSVSELCHHTDLTHQRHAAHDSIMLCPFCRLVAWAKQESHVQALEVHKVQMLKFKYLGNGLRQLGMPAES